MMPPSSRRPSRVIGIEMFVTRTSMWRLGAVVGHRRSRNSRSGLSRIVAGGPCFPGANGGRPPRLPGGRRARRGADEAQGAPRGLHVGSALLLLIGELLEVGLQSVEGPQERPHARLVVLVDVAVEQEVAR